MKHKSMIEAILHKARSDQKQKESALMEKIRGEARELAMQRKGKDGDPLDLYDQALSDKKKEYSDEIDALLAQRKDGGSIQKYSEGWDHEDQPERINKKVKVIHKEKDKKTDPMTVYRSKSKAWTAKRGEPGYWDEYKKGPRSWSSANQPDTPDTIQKSGDMMEAYIKASPKKREEMKKEDKLADVNGHLMAHESLVKDLIKKVTSEARDIPNAQTEKYTKAFDETQRKYTRQLHEILQKADIRDILQKAKQKRPSALDELYSDGFADHILDLTGKQPSSKKVPKPKAGGRYMFRGNFQKEDFGVDAEHAKQYPKAAKKWEKLKDKYKHFDVVLARRAQYNKPLSGQGLQMGMNEHFDYIHRNSLQDTVEAQAEGKADKDPLREYGKQLREGIQHWTMEWDSLGYLDGEQQKGKPKINDVVFKGRDKLGPGRKDEYEVPRTEKEMKSERPGLLIKENIITRFIDDDDKHKKKTSSPIKWEGATDWENLRRQKNKRTPKWGKFKGMNLDDVDKND